jgi:hypothetical protein
MNLDALETALQLLDSPDPRIAPGGVMAPHTGPQLTEAEIARAYATYTDGMDLNPRIRAAVRAFPVPALVGLNISCRVEAFNEALDDALARRLTDTTWRTRGGLIEKYWLLDGSYTAPQDSITGQPMELALAGDVLLPGTQREHGQRFGDHIQVRVSAATWTNVSGLGFGVGFYM